MASSALAEPRDNDRNRVLADWARERKVDLAPLDPGQRAVLVAALRFLQFVGAVPALRRMVGYMLSNCGMDLSSPMVAAVVNRSEQAVRKARQIPPARFWSRLQRPQRGHAAAKLAAADVGPVARFLATHKKCSVAELLTFIKATFGVELDRLTLRRFLKRYGLGCLREDTVEDAPLLSAAPSTAALSS